MTVRILHGDALEQLHALADESVHSIVTDPPYELGFMGKAWDGTGIANSVDLWTEALRVLKPGGHLLSFGGSRTYHRMACAIEDAGFEIRDQIMWVYGSGFPKSLDVSKAIDKQRTEDLIPAATVARWLCDRMAEKEVTRADFCEHFKAENIAQQWTTHWLDGAVKPRVPKWDQWQELKRLLEFGDEMDAEVWRLNGRKGTPSEDYASRPDANHATGVGMRESWTAGKGWNGTASKGGDPVRESARQWQGWGTALKPAHEPIVVARKPLIGTVAANVLKHGTGAINVDGCRVGLSGGDDPRLGGKGAWTTTQPQSGNTVSLPRGTVESSPLGRWPANIIHDGSDEVLALFPDVDAGLAVRRNSGGNTFGGDKQKPQMDDLGYGDSGSAARFFYTAKSSSDDRNIGSHAEDERNHHPTVKPTDLMQYLVRLVTPRGGTVLDPFAGSGSTGIAADREGFDAILIERDAEYIEIAKRRIAGDCPLFADLTLGLPLEIAA